MTERAWPEILPEAPSGQGFSLSPYDPSLRTDMEVGPARVRRITFSRRDRIAAMWRMTQAEFNTFRAWYEDAPWSLAGASDTLAGWTLNDATTAAGSLAPGGRVVSAQLRETSANTQHRAQLSLGPSAQGTLVLSATFKAQGRTQVDVRCFGRDSTARYARLNLSTGTVAATSGIVSATVTDRGGGWYRLTVVVTAGSGPSDAQMRLVLHDGAGYTYAGTPGLGVDVCEINARVLTGFDPFLRTGADGSILGAAGGSAWFMIPLAIDGTAAVSEARCTGVYRATVLSGANWEVEMPLEIRNA